jgi:hypothetical protein
MPILVGPAFRADPLDGAPGPICEFIAVEIVMDLLMPQIAPGDGVAGYPRVTSASTTSSSAVMILPLVSGPR